MYFIILCSVAVGLILLIAILAYFVSGNKVEELPRPQRQQVEHNARRRALQATRNARARQHNSPVQEEEDESFTPDIELPEGKVGAKKLAKLQAKAERKAQREVEDKERQERRKKEELAEEERRKEIEKEKQEEEKRLEEEKKAIEERERREHEEYLKLKEAFSIEEEGFEEGEGDQENLLMDFVNYIKSNKVVVLEDLAAQFKLKTQNVIDRIQDLQNDHILTGVIDDRGKFIYISQDELASVAKFVKQRGRVSIAELAECSNQLINLNPNISVSS